MMAAAAYKVCANCDGRHPADWIPDPASPGFCKAPPTTPVPPVEVSEPEPPAPPVPMSPDDIASLYREVTVELPPPTFDPAEAAQLVAREAAEATIGVFTYSAEQHLAIARDTAKALVDSGCKVHSRGEMLVRIQEVERVVTDDTTGVTKSAKHIGTKAVNQSLLRYEVEKVCKFYTPKTDKKAAAYIRPPLDVIDSIMQLEDWPFKPIAGVMACPSIRSDGTLVLSPGYDDRTNIYYHFDPVRFGKLSQLADARNLTYDMAKWCATQLLDLFKQARFYDYYRTDLAEWADCHGDKRALTRSHSVALCHMITPVTRPAYRTAPLHATIAAAMGQGKSYIQEISSMCSTERELGPISFKSKDDAKNELELDSALMSSLPIVQWDNVNKLVFGGQGYYLSVISQGKKSVRKYHTQDTHEVSCRSTTFFINGINLGFTEEMSRRTIALWLRQRDPGHDWDKAHNPMKMVRERREFYVMCILTITRAYHAELARQEAGKVCTGGSAEGLKRVEKAKAFDSFPGWDRFVRHPLLWLGLPDPMDSSVDLIANAEDRQTEGDILAEIVKVLHLDDGRSVDFTVKRLLKLCDRRIDNRTAGAGGFALTSERVAFENEDLREACLNVAGIDGSGGINSRKLGHYLSSLSDKTVGKHQLVRSRGADGSALTHSGSAVFHVISKPT